MAWISLPQRPEDPRTGNAGLHDFHELLMIALCTVLCGGHMAMNVMQDDTTKGLCAKSSRERAGMMLAAAPT
jgi:hypothetical protein